MRISARLTATLAIPLVVTACFDDPRRVAEAVRNEMEPYFDHREHDPEVLKGRVVTDADFLAWPRQIEIIAGHLVVSDMVSDHVLHFIDPETGSLVRSIGRRGGGPGEFTTFGVLAPYPAADDVVVTLDPTTRRVTWFRVPDGEIVPMFGRSFIELPTHGFVSQLAMLDDHRAVGIGLFREGRLGLFDLARDEARYSGALPGEDDEEPYITRQMAYLTTMAAEPGGQRIALLTKNAGQIQIFTRNGELLFKGDGPYPFAPDYLIDRGNYMAGPRNRHGYKDVVVGRDGFVALFSGRAEAHFRGMSGAHGEFLHEFDWDGSLRRVFRLDREVLAIAFDESRSILYTITETPEPAVLVFSVPEGGSSRATRRR